jgi:hypothetical protein
MVDLKAPIKQAEALKEINYLVYLYEPSTDYRHLASAERYHSDSKRVAKAQVDDACKTEGWVYRKFSPEGDFIPVGYAWLQGDGEVVWKQLVSDHLYLVMESTPGDGDVMLPGWYFADETEGSNGPFPTMDAAQEAFANYCKFLEGGPDNG